MPPAEPAATAWLLAIAAVLIAASALSSRVDVFYPPRERELIALLFEASGG